MSGGLGSNLPAQRLLDLARHGKTLGLLLGEDQLVVDGDLEDAAAAPDELRLEAEPALNLRRQTGGARVVVSHCAVFDTNPRHGSLLSSAILVQSRPAPAGRELQRIWTTPVPSPLKIGMKRSRFMLKPIGACRGRNVTPETKFLDFHRQTEYNRDCTTIALSPDSLRGAGLMSRWGKKGEKKVSRIALEKALSCTTLESIAEPGRRDREGNIEYG